MSVLAAVAAGTMLASGAAGASVAAKAKKVSTEKYAKVVCLNTSRREAAIDGFIDAYNTGTFDDPVPFQSEVIALGDDLVAELTRVVAKLKKVYPDIDHGKKVGKGFVAGVVQYRTPITDALEKFAAADPNGVAFQADISTFQVAIKLLKVGNTNPFTEVDDQDLLGAFADEKACDDVVTISRT